MFAFEKLSVQRGVKAETQGCVREVHQVGNVRSPSARQTLPGQNPAGRAQDAIAAFAGNVRTFVSRRQIIDGTLVQPGAWGCSCVRQSLVGDLWYLLCNKEQQTGVKCCLSAHLGCDLR